MAAYGVAAAVVVVVVVQCGGGRWWCNAARVVPAVVNGRECSRCGHARKEGPSWALRKSRHRDAAGASEVEAEGKVGRRAGVEDGDGPSRSQSTEEKLSKNSGAPCRHAWSTLPTDYYSTVVCTSEH